MARKVEQFRYLGRVGNERMSTEDSSLTEDEYMLVKGNLFSGKTVYKLGIQTLPGTLFRLNRGSSNDSISYNFIGHSGVFELDLKEQIEIKSIDFKKESIMAINDIPSAYLIIDYIYEDSQI